MIFDQKFVITKTNTHKQNHSFHQILYLCFYNFASTVKFDIGEVARKVVTTEFVGQAKALPKQT